MRLIGGLFALALSLAILQPADALVRGGRAGGFVIPTPAVACDITTGNCTGTGGGSSLFTAATCNGVADDAPAFNSFNTWATGTWQASHTGLIELDIPSGKSCEFISGNVNSNFIGTNIKQFQIVGYGATLGDAGGTGGGFFLGGGGATGVQFNGTTSTVRLATVAAGSSTLAVLDTAKCSLWAAGDWALISGIDPQGFGDPPNPQIYEWVQIASVASCAGSGTITLTTPLSYGYKSTWPSYSVGGAFNSDQGGPGTLYQLTSRWDTTQAYYGLTIDQSSAQTNSNGRDITFRDMSCPGSTCFIPSQNKTWRAINVNAPNTALEFDKIIDTVVMQNVTYRRLIVQSGSSPKVWNCTNCTVTSDVNGTAGITTFTNSTIANLLVGASSYGYSSSFIGSNTSIAAMETSGSGRSQIESQGVWAGTTLTVPPNITASAAASCGGSCTRFTVNTTVGWASGITVVFAGQPASCGDVYVGNWAVTVIDATHLTIPAPFVSTCTGGIGILPMEWAVPKANVMFSEGHGPLGPILQVDDLSVDGNGSTVITFSQNGSPISGFPTLPGTSWKLTSHPAPTWSCIGCTGAQNVLDLNSAAASGLPFGAYSSRAVTAANSSSAVAMPTIGALTEMDVTVTAACSGASNFGLQPVVSYQTLGSATLASGWPWTVNAAMANATPRKIFPTTSSGAQSGDTLTVPGANSWLIGIGNAQTLPFYSNVGNCGSASTTITIKADQGVVP